MRLVFEEDGKWVALMVWGSACYHLKPRDAYVGWTNSIRAERLKLVVNNRRFTILSGPGERRNLASECLGLVARELPRLWLKKFRYRPLLAETFCDIERTAGTCYKAAGWIPLGQTQGFTRVNRQDCDFYVPNDRPKAVWVKPLDKDALSLLNARTLPEDCVEGAQGEEKDASAETCAALTALLPIYMDVVEGQPSRTLAEPYRKIAEAIQPDELTEEQLQTHEQYQVTLARYDQLQREYINRRLLPQERVTEDVAQEDAAASEELAQLKRQLWKLRSQERKNLCSVISSRLANGDAAKTEALNGSILKLIGTHRADYYW